MSESDNAGVEERDGATVQDASVSGWAGAATEAGHFRPDIEGLRAIAVIAVLLFHVDFPGFAGGFVGVDVFYVISGFLITGLLRRELAASGTINLATFYARRARRLLPAALVVILATVAASFVILSPLRFPEVAGDAATAAVYVVNYRFILNSIDYLGDTAQSPLLHYWSLAVEEQFYLFWPLIILFAARFLSLRRLAWAIALLGGISFVASLWLTDAAAPVAFFSLPTRAWELAIGAMLAAGVRLPLRIPQVGYQAFGWIGLGLIAASCVLIDPQLPYPGWFALAPTVGAALLIIAGHRQGGAGRWLSTSIPRWIGRISYSLYLWHWPLIILVPIALGWNDLALRLGLVVVAFVAAAMSTRWVEKPFREGRNEAPRQRRWLGVAVTASVAVAVLAVSLGVISSAIARERFSGTPDESPLPSDASAILAAPLLAGPLPRDLRPPLLTALDDVPTSYTDGCLRGAFEVSATPCYYGDPEGELTLALFGDSKAIEWLPALDRLGKERNARIVLIGKGGCTPADVQTWNERFHRVARECATWRENALRQLEQIKPDAVVVSTAGGYTLLDGDRRGSISEIPDVWRAGLTRTLANVARSTPNVVVLADTPRVPFLAAECLATHADVSACTFPRDGAIDRGIEQLARDAAASAGAQFVSLEDKICPNAECPVVYDRYLVYRDSAHLTATFSELLADSLGERLPVEWGRAAGTAP